MNTPAPAEENIITVIRNHLLKHGKLSEFDFVRFRQQAEKELPEPNGFTALGMLACISGNIDDMHKYHKQAIQYAASDQIARHTANYAASLEVSGLLPEALREAQKAWAIDPADAGALAIVITASYNLNEDAIMNEHLEFWRKSMKAPHPAEKWLAEDESDAEDADEALSEYLEHGGESWDDLKAQLGV